MRRPVRLDGIAALGTADLASLTIDVPSLLWASPQVPGGMSGADAPAPRAPVPSEDRSLVLRARAPGTTFHRAVEIALGDQAIPLDLPSTAEERSRGPGHLQPAGDRIQSVVWPLAEGVLPSLAPRGTQLVVWANAAAHLSSPESFVRSALELREAIGPSALLWAPGVALPSNLALLHYLGMDLLDTTAGLKEAVEGRWAYAELDLGGPGATKGAVPSSPLACGCEGCVSRADTVTARVHHATAEYRRELARIRFFLAQGRLRELVEARTVAYPSIGVMARHLDESGYLAQERHAPVAGVGERPYGIEASYRRPEMERFRRRFLERYRPPPSKTLLMLVPCSYTKPYSNSPTHRAFSRAVESCTDPARVHWVSVTSPLGVVPRELENFFPARHYDIPVTGRWTEDERRWVSQGIAHLLSSGGYTHVIAHLPEDEYGWLKALESPTRPWQWTVGSSPTTSRQSLARLEEAVRATGLTRAFFSTIRKDEVRSAISFEMSPQVADALLAGDTLVRGPRWFLSLAANRGDVLATWKEDRGLWRLTAAGAAKVASVAADWCLDVDPGVTLRGDVFAPGALAAGPEVRVGGTVILRREGKVVGVGEATVPGNWIGRLEHGLVVRVRSRGGESPPPTGPEPGAEAA